MKKAAVLLADGFERDRGAHGSGSAQAREDICGHHLHIGRLMVNGSHGINVQTEDLLPRWISARFDMLGCRAGMPGTANLDAHDGVRRVVREFCEKGSMWEPSARPPASSGTWGF